MAIGTGAAILGGAAISAGSSLLGGSSQASGLEDAAQAQLQASREAIGLQRDMFEQGREDLAPFRSVGYRGLNQLATLFLGAPSPVALHGARKEIEGVPGFEGRGEAPPRTITETVGGGGGSDYGVDPVTARMVGMGLGHATMDPDLVFRAKLQNAGAGRGSTTREVPNPAYQEWLAASDDPEFQMPADIQAGFDALRTGGTGQPDYSAFFQSPGYQFRFDEGIRALDRSAAARGKLTSGAHERSLIGFGQGMASEEFNNYANRLATLAGLGQTASTNTASLAASTGSGMANALMAGAANAGGLHGQAATARASGFVGAGNAVNQGLGNFLFAQQAGMFD